MFLFGFEMPCIFGSGFTLPNVFLRPYFAFPQHKPSGQQKNEPKPRRELGWVVEEVLIFKIGLRPQPSHINTYLSTCVLPTEQGAFSDLSLAKPHSDLKSSYPVPSA